MYLIFKLSFLHPFEHCYVTDGSSQRTDIELFFIPHPVEDDIFYYVKDINGNNPNDHNRGRNFR